MPISPALLQIKEDFTQEYMGKFDINSVGIGIDDVLSVTVVTSKDIDKIPVIYKQIPVIVKEIGEIRFL